MKFKDIKLYDFFSYAPNKGYDERLTNSVFQKIRDCYNKPNCLQITKLPYIDLSTEKSNKNDYRLLFPPKRMNRIIVKIDESMI